MNKQKPSSGANFKLRARHAAPATHLTYQLLQACRRPCTTPGGQRRKTKMEIPPGFGNGAAAAAGTRPASCVVQQDRPPHFDGYQQRGQDEEEIRQLVPGFRHRALENTIRVRQKVGINAGRS
jgi:hypothetical protein